MKSFDKGVSYYTVGYATIKINFPEDDVCCNWCQFCRSESDLKRFWCRLTNKMIYNPFVPELPEWCPVTLQK